MPKAGVQEVAVLLGQEGLNSNGISGGLKGYRLAVEKEDMSLWIPISGSWISKEAESNRAHAFCRTIESQ